MWPLMSNPTLDRESLSLMFTNISQYKEKPITEVSANRKKHVASISVPACL